MPLKRKSKNFRMVGLTIIIIPIIFIVMNMVRDIWGGPLFPWERVKSNNAISNMQKQLGLTGKLKIKKMYQDGMPSGAIMAEYTYTENINGSPVSVSDVLEIGMYENKKEEENDLSSQFIFAIDSTYTLQPTYAAFKKASEEKARREIEVNLPNNLKLMDCNLDKYNDEKKLDSLARKNRASSEQSKKIFLGYYYIEPSEAFNSYYHVLSFAFIDSDYSESEDYPTDAEIIAARKLIENNIKQINPSELLPGKYVVSFNVIKDDSKINPENSLSDIGSNSFYGFTIKNNQLLPDSGWGIDRKLATSTVLH